MLDSTLAIFTENKESSEQKLLKLSEYVPESLLEYALGPDKPEFNKIVTTPNTVIPFVLKSGELIRPREPILVNDIDFESTFGTLEVAIKIRFEHFKDDWERQYFKNDDDFISFLARTITDTVLTPDNIWHIPELVPFRSAYDISEEEIEEDIRTNDEAIIKFSTEYYDNFIIPAIKNNWYMNIVRFGIL